MADLHCMLNQRCSRPANAHEYRSRSFKSGEAVRLYDRITLWRWLTLEFDSSVTGLEVNANLFDGANDRIPIVFKYLEHGNLRLVIRDNCSESSVGSLHNYCGLLNIMLEILEEKWSLSRHVEMWNLMKMASYIHKWSNRITEKQLSLVSRTVSASQQITIKELCSTEREFGTEALALAFELVRRGRLYIPGLCERKITLESLITIQDFSLVDGARNG